MKSRTPITIITGPLGSGKTTLVRHLLASTPCRLATIMNELGEVGIDTKIIECKDVRIAELAQDCVCCCLIGEFEDAVKELLDRVDPEHIVIETTGVAEPGALTFMIEQNLPRVRLDGVVGVVDADRLLRFPSLGHMTQMQIESAELLLLNKVDLVRTTDLAALEHELRSLNPTAPILPTERCRVDADVLFGLAPERSAEPPHGIHQSEFDSFVYASAELFDRQKFEQFAADLAPNVVRAKGFVRFPEGTHLFNYVAGRWDMEPFAREDTELVFFGKDVVSQKDIILGRLRTCELSSTS